jgi:hypothetical protein
MRRQQRLKVFFASFQTGGLLSLVARLQLPQWSGVLLLRAA